MSERTDVSLRETAKAQAELRAKFGFVPTSVLRDIRRGELSKRMFVFQNEQPDRNTSISATDQITTDGARENELERRRLGLPTFKRRFAKPGEQKVSYGTLSASIMPAELVKFFMDFYSSPGDTYLDPFMGQGIQLQVATMFGRHYHGYDLSTEFFGYIAAVVPKLRIPDGIRCTYTHGDSRFPAEIPDGIGDFSFHSPPYWDIEFYGEEEGQLGNRSYEEFLDGMEDVARAWLPKFKPGAWHVVNVNDFRKNGRYYCYHAALIQRFVCAGWEMYDTWIVEGLVGGLSRMFAAQRAVQRAAKVHEYCLVFRRP
mgnify:CR=1 FL=1